MISWVFVEEEGKIGGELFSWVRGLVAQGSDVMPLLGEGCGTAGGTDSLFTNLVDCHDEQALGVFALGSDKGLSAHALWIFARL